MNKDDLNRLANVSIRGLVEARNSSEVLVRIQSLVEAARILDARTRTLPENLSSELLSEIKQMVSTQISMAMNQIMKNVSNAINNAIKNALENSVGGMIQNVVNNLNLHGGLTTDDDPGFVYWTGEKFETRGSSSCDDEDEL